ncbi:MAG: hypothetical protein EU536_03480, partial [Promethearchaeota archaeon]
MKTRRNSKLIVLFSLFCLSFLWINLNFPENPPQTMIPSDGSSDVLNSSSIITVWQDNGIPVSVAPHDQANIQVISDGLGGIIMVWEDYQQFPSTDIYAQRINSSGHAMWGNNGTIICNDTSTQIRPVITTDGDGGAIIAWQDQRVGNFEIYVQRINSTGQSIWTPNGVRVTTSGGDDTYPAIASDGLGGAIIVYQCDIPLVGINLFARRIDSTGTLVWTTTNVCVAPGTQQKAKITSDGANGAIVTWEDFRDGSSDLYAQRMNLSGSMLWTANGVILSNEIGDQASPDIISDGNSGAIIAWQDYRGGTTADIYAQRIDHSGNTLWTPNGTAICVQFQNQLRPQVATDGNSGAIIVWDDARGTSSDIYVQKINASGQTLWTPNGIAIISDAYSQIRSAIASDGVGGAFITWQDYRGGATADIYAQHIGSNGITHWSTNGIVICNETGDQVFPRIIQNGTNGAIIAWQDYRSGAGSDIYAQAILSIDIENPPAPIISSPTHPDQNFVYSSPFVSLEWTEPPDASGIQSYYYLYDQNASTIPNVFDTETSLCQVNLTNISDGTWYFHVRAKDMVGNLGETGHFKFTIDRSCAISLTNYTLIPSTNQILATVLADFDLDGDLDIAYSDNSSAIYILLNPFDQRLGLDPFINLSNWTKILVGTRTGYAEVLKVADLNNDGTPDLISGHRVGPPFGSVTIWKNNGTPWMANWASRDICTKLSQTIFKIEIDDLDNDGNLDIVYATRQDATIHFAYNPYSYGYDPFSVTWNTEPIRSSVEIYDIKLVDLDRNGFVDVIFTAELGKISVIRQNEKNNWININSIINNSIVIHSLEIADLDYNGAFEIIVSTANCEILVFRHNGTPFSTGWSKTVVGQFDRAGYIPYALSLSDLDKNGYLDIITAFSATSQETYLYVYSNNKRPFHDIWANASQGTYEPVCREIALGDLDHNGAFDVVFGGSNLYLARNEYERLNPIPIFADAIQIFSSGNLLQIQFGDLDNDGDLDAIGRIQNDGTVYGWRNNGAPFGNWTQFTIASIPTSGSLFTMELVDIDHDGWLDIVAGFGLEGHILRNNHTPWDGLWENYKFAPSTGQGYYEIVVADFDHDGNLDIACTSAKNTTGGLYMWRNNGTPFRENWDEYKIGWSVGGVEMRYLEVADFDKDGWHDLVSTDYNGRIYFWRNNHTPFTNNWTIYQYQTFGSGANRIAVADLDFDGDPDVATYRTDSTINTKILECNETSFNGSWNSNTIYSFSANSHNGIAIGDVDCDGWSDVIVMNSYFLGGGESRPEMRVLTNNHTPFHDSWDPYVLPCSTNNLFAHDIHLVDIDRDGDLDILAAMTGAGGAGLYCWTNLADQDFTGPATPIIHSSTHPNQDSWYNSPNITLNWSAHDPSGLNNYLYCYDQNPTTIPNQTHQSTTQTAINFTVPSEGIWYFHIRGNDTHGNIGETGHYSIKVDTTPPIAYNPFPLPGSYTYNTTSSIQIVISDALSELNFSTLLFNVEAIDYNSSSPQVNISGQNPSMITFTPLAPYLNGQVVDVTVQISDNAQNWLTAYSWNFIIDSEAPMASNPYPLNGSYVSDTTPTIFLDLNDTLSGINASTILFTVNGSPEVHSWNGVTLSWNSTGPYASGTLLNLSVTVEDNVGNVMPTYAWWFSIDIAGPQASNPNPPNNTFVSNPSPIITIDLHDFLSGVNISTIILNVNLLDYRISDPELSIINQTILFTPPSAYLDGQIVNVSLDSSDLLGNAMPTYSWFFIVDLSGPTASNPAPVNNGYTGDSTPLVTLTLTDAYSGVNASTLLLKVEGIDYWVTDPELTY